MGKKYCCFFFFFPCGEMRLRNEWLKIANIKSVASAAALRVAGGGVVLGGGVGEEWGGGRSQSRPSLAQRRGGHSPGKPLGLSHIETNSRSHSDTQFRAAK